MQSGCEGRRTAPPFSDDIKLFLVHRLSDAVMSPSFPGSVNLSETCVRSQTEYLAFGVSNNQNPISIPSSQFPPGSQLQFRLGLSASWVIDSLSAVSQYNDIQRRSLPAPSVPKMRRLFISSLACHSYYCRFGLLSSVDFQLSPRSLLLSVGGSDPAPRKHKDNLMSGNRHI